MRRGIIYSIVIVGLVLTGAWLGFTPLNKPDSHHHPRPTDGYIPETMEDGSTKNLKKAWFEAIHSCAADTDWRKIERTTAIEKYQAKNNRPAKDPGFVDIAGGKISGIWEEKGSNNLSGCIMKTAYNRQDDKLYALAGGGSLWAGGVDGLSWEVINQDLRFDGRFLDVVYPKDDKYRLLTSVGGLPYYKDSDSEVWEAASGIESSFFPKIKNQFVTGKDGRYVFFLAQVQDGAEVQLYFSQDFGSSYEAVKDFNTNDLRDVAVAANPQGEEVYLIEEVSTSNSHIYVFNYNVSSLTLLTWSSEWSFGDGDANLQLVRKNGAIKLYAYNEYNELKSTTNNGASPWSSIATLPITPWQSALFISPSDPQVMMIGGINAYRSTNGGYTWNIVNEWSQYYDDTATKLHADIMYINEVKTNSEDNIVMISTHGGIHRSFDRGATLQNISYIQGHQGLNVSQYYSVKTSPYDENIIFTGSQDQGIQRGRDFDEGVTNFAQFKAGDYGHLQFTNFGRSLWSIYPGGDMYYYPDPINSDESLQPFDLLLNNPSIWLPPIITSPYNPNAVLIAGGSLLNSTGSHIVDVAVDDLGQLFGTQWPFNFAVSGGDVSAMSYLDNSDEFYVLTTNGKFYKSINRGVHFEEKDAGLSDAHHLYGNTILTSNTNRDRILIAGSGYDNPAVYISYDRGESFQPIIDGLPTTTVFQMVYDETEEFIFAATEAGPYVMIVEEGQWYELGQGVAPNQRYWSVEYLPNLNKVRYGTFGRGIWDFNIDNLNYTAENTSAQSKLSFSPNPANHQVNITLDSPVTGQLRVVSVQGISIHEQTLRNQQKLTIDVSDYANGLYYIIFENESSKTLSSIMIKS